MDRALALKRFRKLAKIMHREPERHPSFQRRLILPMQLLAENTTKDRRPAQVLQPDRRHIQTVIRQQMKLRRTTVLRFGLTPVAKI